MASKAAEEGNESSERKQLVSCYQIEELEESIPDFKDIVR